MTDKPSASRCKHDVVIPDCFECYPSASERREWTNAPGHCHSEIGIWDSDNGDLAGKICELCKRWNEFPALTKEVAELKAERESHFALEESVLSELKAERDELKLFVSSVELHESIANAKAVLKERDELRAGVDAFKYAADQLAIAADAWKLQAERLEESIREHVTWEPGTYPNECVGLGGAEGLTEALAAFMDFREGK